MMTITPASPGKKYTQNKILILILNYLETFFQPIFFSIFEFHLSLGCGFGSAFSKGTLPIICVESYY